MMRKKEGKQNKKKTKTAQEKGQLSSKGKHLRVFQRTSRSHLVVGKKDIKAKKKKKEATRGRVRNKKKKTENKESSMYITHIKKKKKKLGNGKTQPSTRE